MKRKQRKGQPRTLLAWIDGMQQIGEVISTTSRGGLLTGYQLRVGRRVVWVATDEVVQ